MRLVIARCSVDYAGRLTAHLPEAVRLIMVKADGCVAIHADGGAYKPLNWMNAPNTLVIGDEAWTVTNPKGESLTITLHEVLSDTEAEFGDDPGLQKDGVEAHLQELLAALAARHRGGTDAGAPRVPDGDRADRPAVPRSATGRSSPSRSSGAARSTASSNWPATSSGCTSTRRSAVCAVCTSPRSSSRRHACWPKSRGFRVVEVDYDELRGLRPADLRLF